MENARLKQEMDSEARHAVQALQKKYDGLKSKYATAAAESGKLRQHFQSLKSGESIEEMLTSENEGPKGVKSKYESKEGSRERSSLFSGDTI